MPRMYSTPKPISWSAAKKKIAAMKANTTTMIVEIMVSRLEGHVTFAVSARTCWRNVNGLTVLDAICRSVCKNLLPETPYRPVAGTVFLSCRLVGQACKDPRNHTESVLFRAPMHFGRVKPASQPHAPRVCLGDIKPIPQPRKW